MIFVISPQFFNYFLPFSFRKKSWIFCIFILLFFCVVRGGGFGGWFWGEGLGGWGGWGGHNNVMCFRLMPDDTLRDLRLADLAPWDETLRDLRLADLA